MTAADKALSVVPHRPTFTGTDLDRRLERARVRIFDPHRAVFDPGILAVPLAGVLLVISTAVGVFLFLAG